MGFKRPIEDEYFHEFPIKHPREDNFGNEVSSFSQNLPVVDETLQPAVPGEGEGDDGLFLKLQPDDLDLDTGEFDSGSGPVFYSPFAPEFVEFHFPRRLPPQIKDTYSSLLEGPPRKLVPIGEDHQAYVPEWYPVPTEILYPDSGETLMGDCVHLPDPESRIYSDDMAGKGRKDCSCPDEGSIRCVQEHIKEARERLREFLGNEKFVNLGFCDMGENVSENWTEEEERVFHEIVYMKSASHGENFWDYLSIIYPYRKMNELVSYYFNVFVLRRRSVQNRSEFLNIDSDNDEWDPCYWGPLGFDEEAEAEEDAQMKCPLPLDENVGVNSEAEAKADDILNVGVDYEAKAKADDNLNVGVVYEAKAKADDNLNVGVNYEAKAKADDNLNVGVDYDGTFKNGETKADDKGVCKLDSHETDCTFKNGEGKADDKGVCKLDSHETGGILDHDMTMVAINLWDRFGP